MAQIPGSGFVVQPLRGLGRFLTLLGLTAAVAMLLLATSWVQAQSATTSSSTQKNNAPISTASPVTPPVVAGDGKQLTIDAENSTLASVLNAVRERTGASIEIPGTAARERVFVHLGPGPARDIISSLLYGTSFDYILEAAEDDPDTLRSVVLTARGLGDGSNDVVAGATVPGGGGGSTLAAAHRGGTTDGRTRADGVRMMTGWASSGKTSFQADAEAALAAEQAAGQDSAPAQDSAAAQDPAAAQAPAAAADTSEGSGNGQTPVVPSTENASNSSPSTTDSNDDSEVGRAIQNMTRMFEQRRQIQTKQNQIAPPSN